VATILAPLTTIMTAGMLLVSLSAVTVEWVLPLQLVGLWAMTLLFAVSRWLVQRGKVTLAAVVTTGMLFLSSTSSALNDGSSAAFPAAFAVAIAIGGITLRRPGPVPLALFAGAFILAVHGLQAAGLITLRRPLEDVGISITQAVSLIVLGAVIHWANLALRRALTQVSEQERTASELQQGLLRAQRMESIGRLAGGVAHDFNNLLTVAMGNASVLLANAELSAEDRESCIAILKACRGGSNLTRQLLAFGRRQVVSRQLLDPAEVVEDFRPVLKYMGGSGATLRVKAQTGLGCVEADARQVQHALANLVINAAQASPKGGHVDLSLESVVLEQDRSASHGTIPAGRYLVLRVHDAGAGMDPSTLASAFDPFFTTKKETGGSGLGLAVVHGVVHQNGGHAEIESATGAGTTVSLWFPHLDGQPTWKPAEASSFAADGLHAHTVLLVDDDDEARRAVKMLLQGAGARVFDAPGATEALELAAQKHDFTVAILDVVMPTTPGPMLAAELARAGFRAPVIFLTGYADPDALRKQVGEAASVLYKPVSAAELAHAIALSVEHGRSEPARTASQLGP
jgi:signal transduction histidine kinase/CheY-like chemotaxis protein